MNGWHLAGGGALSGSLAIAFQGLLRNAVAGLVALINNHCAVDDWVEVNGLHGEVVDLALLVALQQADIRLPIGGDGGK